MTSTLLIPDYALAEAVRVVRRGLDELEGTEEDVSANTRQNLAQWCDDAEEYLVTGAAAERRGGAGAPLRKIDD